MRVLWHLLVFGLVGGVGAGDAGDDFSNNLFSDLAPLLALFGERVTMQFMSQSMGWADNVVLAMCPLGIITAIVGAIRTGGPAWLKAIIGRARESRAIAEAELMSSTSKEVCELWNGSEIVRVMGNGPIREFIVLIPPGALDENSKPRKHIRVGEMKDSLVSKYLEEYDQHASSFFKPSTWRRFRKDKVLPGLEDGTEKDEAFVPQEILVIRNTDVDAPNITLNAHDQVSRSELRIVAVFGTLLQLAVLVYFGLSVHRFQFKKDDSRVQDYALPCAVTGTVLLVTGILLCGHVVESSTVEKTYRVKSGCEARIVWLQKAGTVNDQTFESHVIFPENQRTIITTSQRATVHRQPGSAHRGLLKIKAVVGTVVSLAGFLAQFIGLRGMHWSSSVTQLGAVIVMTILRSWVRRGLSKTPKSISGVSGFELDWFAMTFADLSNAMWRNASDQTAPSSNPSQKMRWTDGNWRNSIFKVNPQSTSAPAGPKDQGPIRDTTGTSQQPVEEQETSSPAASVDDPDETTPTEHVEDIEVHDALIHTKITAEESSIDQAGNISNEETPRKVLDTSFSGSPTETNNIKEEPASDHVPTEEPPNHVLDTSLSTTKSIFSLRRTMGRLSGWSGPASTEAISLARSMEIAMDTLLGGVGGTIQWIVEPVSEEPITFILQKTNNGWQAMADQVEAALSLWLFSVLRIDASGVSEARKSKNNYMYIPTHGLPPLDVHLTAAEKMDDTWLRSGYGDFNQSFRILGHYTPSLHRDLMWWMPDGMTRIKSGKLREPSNRSLVRKGHRRLVHSVATGSGGYLMNGPFPIFSSRGTPELPPREYLYTEDDLKCHAELILTVPEYQPLATLYPQDLFSTFMLALARDIALPIPGYTSIVPLQHEAEIRDWRRFRLQNDLLGKLVERVAHTGLGPVEEIYLSLIPAFSTADKMPDSDGVVEWVRKHCESPERNGLWAETSGNYAWLLSISMTYPLSSLIATRSAAIVLQYVLEMEKEQARVDNMDHGYPRDMTRNPIVPLWRIEDLVANIREPHYLMWDCLLDMAHLEEAYTKRGVAREAHIHLARQSSLHRAVITDNEGDFGVRRREESNLPPLILSKNTSFPSDRATLDCRDVRDWTPLHFAVIRGSLKKVRALLEVGANPNAKNILGRVPLHYAAITGDHPILQRLLLSGAEVDAKDRFGRAAVHMAASTGNSNIIPTLVEAGANLGALDCRFQSPLHLATYKGHEECVNVLWNQSNLNLRDLHGRTPFHISSISGILEKFPIVEQSVSSSTLEIMDRAGMTPLICAARYNRGGTVRYLLNKGANPNHQDIEGCTATYIAATYGYLEVLKACLEHPAVDIGIKNNAGRCPLTMAKSHAKLGGTTDGQRLLEKAHGKVEGST